MSKDQLSLVEKERLGDLEIDTVIGKNHKGALITINDRVSCIKRMAKQNGKEFAEHKTIGKKLDMNFYFAKPYHSWERGANENMNALIRQHFPKGSSFENISIEDVQRVQDVLNNRPRKKFTFSTPDEFLLLDLTNRKVAFMT